MKNENFDDERFMSNVILSAETLIRNILDSNESNNIFYQYTKMQTLDDILNGGCLRATDMKYLNDSLEYQLGIDAIDKLYSGKPDYSKSETIRNNLNKYSNEYEKDAFSTFSVSFCEDGDLLSQWITYAKEGGISIGFDFSSDSLFWGQKINNNYFMTNTMKNPLKVMYVSRDSFGNLDNNQVNIEKIMNMITSTGMTTHVEKLAFYMVLCFIKNAEFLSEKEHRIVSVPCYNGISNGVEKKCLSEIKTVLQSSHVFRPYIELYPIREDQTLAKLPIAELIVGPASNQKNIYRSLVYKIEHSFVESLKIELPSPKQFDERKDRYDKIVAEMEKKKMTKDEINDKIHFCEKFGIIIRTSESSYVF